MQATEFLAGDWEKTGTRPLEQVRSPAVRSIGTRSVLIGADHLAAVDRAECPPRLQVDGVLDEPDRAITEGDVDAAGVPARRGRRAVDVLIPHGHVAAARAVGPPGMVVDLEGGVERIGHLPLHPALAV